MLGFVLPWLSVAGGCTSRTWHSGDRDAPLVTASETERFRCLLAAALDREALYTLAGGLKPLSTGFWRGSISVQDADLTELREVRRALAPLRDETYYADVQVFATSHDGARTLEAYVVHRASLAALIARESSFFAPLGIAPCTHPAEVVTIVDRLPRRDRWRAYGLLFGYPVHAVDFFVEATDRARADGTEMGPGKDRTFVEIPTASATKGQFTYAVPLDHTELPEDRALRQEATCVLAEYLKVAREIKAARDPMPLVRALNRAARTR